MNSFRRYATPGLALSLTLLMSACGGASSGDAGNAATGGESPFLLTGDDRTATLEECAAKEDGLTWYTSLAGEIVDAMTAGFNDEYPDIKVEVFRGEQTDVVSRVVQENQAGRLQGDVVEVTSDGFRVLGDLNVLTPYTSPALGDYSERFTIPAPEGGDGVLGVGDRASYVGFAYNTDKVSEADVPKDFEDLLDPALKGKLAITSSTTGVRFVGNVFERFGQEEGQQFLEQLADQDVRVEAVSGSALAELIGRGEVAASPGIFRNHAQQLQEEGMPIEWVPLEPVTANVGYAGAFADADSPCSAALFLDFELGDKGTAIYESLKYPRPSEDVGFEAWVPDETFDSTDDYNEAFETWSSTFDEIFGQ
jgi:ABC-type Fe3+ transport system substrate-binding protein